MKNLLLDESFNSELFDVLTNSNGLLDYVYRYEDGYKYQLSGYYEESFISSDDLLYDLLQLNKGIEIDQSLNPIVENDGVFYFEYDDENGASCETGEGMIDMIEREKLIRCTSLGL